MLEADFTRSEKHLKYQCDATTCRRKYGITLPHSGLYIFLWPYFQKKGRNVFYCNLQFHLFEEVFRFQKEAVQPFKKKQNTSLQEKVLHSKPCLSESTEALTTKCTAVVNMQRNQPCHHHISTVNTDASMHNITLLHILYLVDL